ncbi:unnamed protein product [Durusdinium trenchii]|uniref:Peptidase S1 domain-containing protein n=1 Tax=Durusdinium trenchii TaxID=1381693 RepID=A0ABP0IQJ3_9DINO
MADITWQVEDGVRHNFSPACVRSARGLYVAAAPCAELPGWGMGDTDQALRMMAWHLETNRFVDERDGYNWLWIFMHPLYNQNVPHDYDFAILELDKAMPLNECVGVACLPHRDEMPGTNCSITGWGTLKSFGKTPEVLQEASVKLLTSADCEVNYTKTRDIITGSMLCASGVSEKGIVDTCQGDSGGPLSCAEDGRFVLRGVTSWGQGCAYANFPGVYGKVQSVMSWINDVTAQKVRKVYSDDQQVKMNISGINFNGSMWKVVAGNCAMDSSHCIMSPGYPKEYPVKDACTIAVNESAAVPIHVVNFSTEEKFDALVENCKFYSGKKGPEKVVPTGVITWHSDESVVSAGWKICPGHWTVACVV